MPCLRSACMAVPTLLLAAIAAAAPADEGFCEVGIPADKCSHHVLLQHANHVLRAATPSEDWAMHTEAVDAVSGSEVGAGIFEDAEDPSCTPGLGCNLKDSISSNRSVVCVVMSERHECWDVCNTKHTPEDYQTGNILMDLEVQKSVQDTRAGMFESVKCLSTIIGTHAETSVLTEAAVDSTVQDAAAAEVDDAAGAANSGNGAAADSSVSEADAEVVATTAEFDEAGYKEVAALSDHKAMVSYIRRVARNLGCRVMDESGLEGIVPYYSGENTSQTFAALEAELIHTCISGKGSWLASMPAFPAETAQREVPGVALALTASFDEDGYRAVATLKDERQMERYIRRVITDLLGGYVKDEGDLEGMVPYYSGTKSTQSFAALVKEIMNEMFRPDGWAVHPVTKVQKKKVILAEGMATVLPDAHAGAAGETLVEEARVVNSPSAFEDCPFNAAQAKANVPLDEQGYSALLELSNNCAMKQFMHRVVEYIGCKVENEAGMRGLVPFYSGTKGSSSFEDLVMDLAKKCDNADETWLVVEKGGGATSAISIPSKEGGAISAISMPSNTSVSQAGHQRAAFTQASSVVHNSSVMAPARAAPAANHSKEAPAKPSVQGPSGGKSSQKAGWPCFGSFCLR